MVEHELLRLMVAVDCRELLLPLFSKPTLASHQCSLFLLIVSRGSVGLFAASWLFQWRSLFGSVETLNLYTYYVYSSNDKGTTEFLFIECTRGNIIGSGMVRLYT